MYQKPNNLISLENLGYIKPIWYFHLLPFNNNPIFLDYRKLSEEKKQVIAFDHKYTTEDAKLWDAAFQGLNKGLFIKPDERLDIINFSNIVSSDIYRFLRKYYKSIWVIYVFILRLILKRKPLREMKSFAQTRKIKRSPLFKPVFEYPSYCTKSSNLVESNQLISIIIPTLNRYESLSNLLLDLTLQKYSNFELIIIDQSDDFTNEFYNNYDLNIKIIRQEEKALWKARNQGIIEARSNLLVFLDDDSRIKNDWIVQHLKCIDFFNADISAGVSKSIIGENVPENYSFFRIADQLDTGNVLIKREVFSTCGLFDRQFEKQRMGDGEFGLRAYLHGFKSVSNHKAVRIHTKYYKGGLRDLGSWDSFRPINLLSPRPIPSVLYFWRNYWGNKLAVLALIQTIPFSLNPYKLKGKKMGNILSMIIFLLFFPLIFLQVIYSWNKANKMIHLGPQIKKI